MTHPEATPTVQVPTILGAHITDVLPADAYWRVLPGSISGVRPLEDGSGITSWGASALARLAEPTEAMTREQVTNYTDIDKALRNGYVPGTNDPLFESSTLATDNMLWKFERQESQLTDIIETMTILRNFVVAERRSRVTTKLHELNLAVAEADGTLWAKTAPFRDERAAPIVGFQLTPDDGKTTPKVQTILHGKDDRYGVGDVPLTGLHMHVAQTSL